MSRMSRQKRNLKENVPITKQGRSPDGAPGSFSEETAGSRPPGAAHVQFYEELLLHGDSGVFISKQGGFGLRIRISIRILLVIN